MATNKWASTVSRVVYGMWVTTNTGTETDALSENADGTVPTETATTANYVYKLTDSSSAFNVYSVTTPSIPANEALVGVYPYLQIVRHATSGTTMNFGGGVYFQSTSGGAWYSMSSTYWSGVQYASRVWKSGTAAWPYSVNPNAYYTNPGGAPDAQNLAVMISDKVIHIGATDNRTRFHEAGLVFQYRSIPAVTSFAATAGSLANATFPTFTWTYADTDDGNDSQVGFIVNTYLTTPSSSDNRLHGSGTVGSTAATYTIPSGTGFTPTPGVSYTSFIRTYKFSGATYVWSDWDSATWTLSSTPPNPPTVTASYDSTDNEVDLTVTTGHNMLSYQNSSAEDSGSVGDWASASNITAVTNQSTPTPPTGGGSRVLRFTPSGAVTILAICNQTHSVAAGSSYYLRADLRGDRLHHLRVRVRARDRVVDVVHRDGDSTGHSGHRQHGHRVPEPVLNHRLPVRRQDPGVRVEPGVERGHRRGHRPHLAAVHRPVRVDRRAQRHRHQPVVGPVLRQGHATPGNDRLLPGDVVGDVRHGLLG
jgi:hypothetical protein